MKSIIILMFLFVGFTGFAQSVTNHEVEPKGIYKEINLSNDIKVITRLLDTNFTHSRSNLIDSIEQNSNKYIPPVLYSLSNILFVEKKYSDACFWFYLAQLRARYDANRCTDKTASAANYNQTFGPIINDYAFNHLDTLEIVVNKVVIFAKDNEEQYDQRWINLTGMDAMTYSLSDKPINKELSVDKKQWPAIKENTINTYYNSFKEELAVYKKKHQH